MISSQRKNLPQLFVQWLCSGGSDIFCKYGTLAWMVWTSVVSWGVSMIFSLLVAAVGFGIFSLMRLCLGRPEGASGRRQINSK